MAWYTILFNLFKPKMDWGYFEDKPFEKEGKLYKYFGVHFYRKILVWIGWEKMYRQKNPMKANLTTLRARDYNTKESEFGHLIIAMIVFAFTVWFTKSLDEAKWLIITNLFLNIYPIIVQRYNRPRYSRVIGYRLRHHLIL
ncbi:hypothetical protein [Pontibacter harenae]|uniref:glycosyl-4,4'-diaponeurosporenoate acyltransferase CrtO family protein n=1 Tax=Pontibacter harenae TaxID=2894083 RepID=UPI001E55CAB2|nr:hypothetical protein [Pontibacter harenae]MCC9167909.1 hypothetical protein [Pontibacter harenae]